jgi:predicted DNA-binding protein YlxM (UPF0122 family)
MSYAALIADVRGSRDLDNWSEVFKSLKHTLTLANRRFKDDLVVKFHPTVGDEFQGVLTRPEVAFDAYIFLKSSLSPLRLYFGLGVGELEKSGSGDTGLRGSAFYRARTALEECKTENGQLRIHTSEDPNRIDNTTRTLFILTEAVQDMWTERQRQIVWYYFGNPQLTLAKVGHYFKISQPAVTKTLKKTNFEAIVQAYQTIKEVIIDNYNFNRL